MTRASLLRPRTHPGLNGSHQRAGNLFVGLILLLLHAHAGFASADAVRADQVSSGAVIRLAVAPFAGESDGLPISRILSARLAQRAIERLIAPDVFVADAEHEPPAARIRQWAYTTAVDTVIVGRVFESGDLETGQRLDGFFGAADSDADSGPFVEAVLRSGHSGAEIGRHRVPIAGHDRIDAAADRLAAEILGDLGYHATNGVDAAPHRDPRSPEPAVRAAAAPSGDPDAGTAEVAFGVLRNDQPIEINAEEAEILDRGENRRLVFQRNVRVRQGNVRLESDRLEAEYQKGRTEPDRLIAVGAVRVDQGDRRARCDRAVYLRVEQKLSCQGRAELVQGCDVVRGNAIEFDLAGDEAHVVGAASIVIRPSGDESREAPSACRTIAGEGVL